MTLSPVNPPVRRDGATFERGIAMQKERNYTIEFFRFMFAVNFVLIHACMIYPIGFLRGFPLFVNGFDVIIPFMAFSGYFLMQGYKKQQGQELTDNVPASRQAWNYLRARLVGLLPVFLLAQFMGSVHV